MGIFIKAEEAIETIFPSEENEFYTKGPAEQLLSDANSSISIQQNFKNRYKCHLCRRVFTSKFVLANHLKVTHEPWIKLDLQSQIDTLGFQRKRK